MSAIIKQESLAVSASVRIVAIGPKPMAVRAACDEAVIDHAAVERAALAAETDALREALDRSASDAETAARKAYEDGRKDALREALDRETDRIDVLADGVAEATASFAHKLEAIDGLAALLARRALARMFGETNDYAPMVEAMLAQQLDMLRAGSAIAVHVSPHDFGSEDGLRRLSLNVAGIPDLAVDETLPAGGCRIDLKLGHVDLSVAERWGQLAAVLDELAVQAAR
jgi:type III secretion protein L